MKGIRFYADLPGTELEPVAANGFYANNIKRAFGARTTIRDLKTAAQTDKRCNVIALLLGKEHQCHDFTQEALAAVSSHADSDTCLTSVAHEYLRQCRRVPETLARQLHPRLFARLDDA
jgi:hypothetical protein